LKLRRGDYICGIEGKKLRKDRHERYGLMNEEDRDGSLRVIFIMKIDDVMSFNEYFNHKDFDYKKSTPSPEDFYHSEKVPNNLLAYHVRGKDEVEFKKFETTVSQWVWSRNSDFHDNETDRKKDIIGNRVFIGKLFSYHGRKPPILPTEFEQWVPPGKGVKYMKVPRLSEKLYGQICSFGKNYMQDPINKQDNEVVNGLTPVNLPNKRDGGCGSNKKPRNKDNEFVKKEEEDIDNPESDRVEKKVVGKTCFYRMTGDRGFAPNPYGKYCTLSCSTPNHEKCNLRTGDYICGVEDLKLAKIRHEKWGLMKDEDNDVGADGGQKLRVIYMMKIDKVLSLDDYFNHKDFQYKKLEPSPDNFYQKEEVPNNLIAYHFGVEGDGSEFIENTTHQWKWPRDSFHDSRELRIKDIRGNRVFIGEKFSYHGRQPPLLGARFKPWVPSQGEKFKYMEIPSLSEELFGNICSLGEKLVQSPIEEDDDDN